MSNVREVSRLVTAHHQQEGAGFIVRRPLPSLMPRVNCESISTPSEGVSKSRWPR